MRRQVDGEHSVDAVRDGRDLIRGGRAGRLRAGLICALFLALGIVVEAGVAAAAEPVIQLDPNPTVGYTSAEVSGSINPEDNPLYPLFQASQEPESEGWPITGSLFEQLFNAGEPLEPGSGVHNLTDKLTGLTPGTAYKLRLGAVTSDFTAEFFPPPPFVTFETTPVAKPTVTLDPASAVTGTSAHLSGTIVTNAPGGPLGPEAEAAFAANWHFECDLACPGATSGTVEAAAGSEGVSAELTGLEPNKTYNVTLEASNAGLADHAQSSFATAPVPPVVTTTTGASTGSGGYILQGVVNPRNSLVTSCEFLYGPDSNFGHSVPCETAPGEGSEPVEVTARVSGLQVGSHYHVKLVASSGGGPGDGGDVTILAAEGSMGPSCPNEQLRAENNSLLLPECRAYEQASDPHKAGNQAKIYDFSPDGGLVFQTLSGNVANSGPGSPTTFYAALRGDHGWETIADLNGPGGSPFSGGNVTRGGSGGGTLAFSSDLRSSIWFLGTRGQSGDATAVYVRNPAGQFVFAGDGAGHFSQVPNLRPTTPGNLGRTPLLWNYFLGASADLSTIVLEAERFENQPVGLLAYDGSGTVAPQRVDVDGQGQPCGISETAKRPTKANAVSADGRVIFYNAASCGGGIWARVDEAHSYHVSESDCTRSSAEPCLESGEVLYQGASLNGDHVFFTTTSQLVNADTDETSDLYGYDVPVGSGGGQARGPYEITSGGADVQGVVCVSGDGSYVYFVAKGALADNRDAMGRLPQVGDDNLYVWHRDAGLDTGETTFIGKVLPQDVTMWGEEPIVGPHLGQASAAGNILVFQSASRMVASDTDQAADIYRYDASDGELIRVSTDESGVGGNAEISAEIGGVLNRDGVLPTHRLRTAMSDSGNTIAFATTEALSPNDTNEALDVYVWHSGHVSLLSDGSWPRGVVNTSFGGAGQVAGDGKDIYFTTAEKLTPTDTDTVADVYDARLLGGFPAPTNPSGCVDEAQCRGPAGTAPVDRATATAGAGPGNPKPRQSCRHGRVRRHGKCVAPRKPAGHHKKKHAAGSGGSGQRKHGKGGSR
jgi:hypothetical protein